jgi:hypothetical protein
MTSDYETQLNISSNSYYEILYRIKLVEDAIGLYYFYGRGWNQRQRKDPLGVGFRPEDQARYFAVQFAFLQIAAILDQQGKYALHMQKNTFSVSSKRLKKLFPTYEDLYLDKIVLDVNLVLFKHKNTINTVFKVRNSRIGHISDITHKVLLDDDYDNTYFRLQNNIPPSFRFVRITELCSDLSFALFTI